jgi:hypothetical protein
MLLDCDHYSIKEYAKLKVKNDDVVENVPKKIYRFIHDMTIESRHSEITIPYLFLTSHDIE